MALGIKKVGVIGSGQMGNGIAHVAALGGFDVVLNDIAADRVKSAMATINGNLSRQVAKKVISEDQRKKALARISGADRLEGLAADLTDPIVVPCDATDAGQRDALGGVSHGKLAKGNAIIASAVRGRQVRPRCRTALRMRSSGIPRVSATIIENDVA